MQSEVAEKPVIKKKRPVPGQASKEPYKKLDYSLTGENATRAIELGLAEADWYQSPIKRAEMRKLLTRKDGPAIRDTLFLLAILVGAAFATIQLWGTWWVVLPYLESELVP